MNQPPDLIKCEYCAGLNECGALDCRHCGAALEAFSRNSDLEERKKKARELLQQAARQFEQAGNNFGEARKHFEGARESLKPTED